MIEWIVTSSALILLVLVLRLAVRERVSPRLRYALWALVLVRLLLPGTFWESRASVMTPIAAQEVRQEAVPGDFPGFTLPFAPDSNPYLDSVKAEIVDPSATGQSFLDPTKYLLPEQKPEQKEPIDWKMILTGVWLTEIAAVELFLVGVNLKFYLDLKRKRQTVGEYRGRSVYLAEGLATPCLFGLFRPAIYLTPGLEEDETEHVLAHEYAHFRQGDHIWAVLRGVCLTLHWYNPLVWLAAGLSRRDCELSCDEGAVRLLGEERRADYGRTLVGLVARRTTARDLACCATTMTGGKSALKERVALLVKRPRTTAVMAVLVAAACVAFAACTFTGAKAAEEPQEPDVPAVQDQDTPPGEAVPGAWDAAEYAEAARQLLEEEYGGAENVQDCRVNDVEIREWQFDPGSGNRQASFSAEVMVLVPPEEHYLWMPGNTVAAEDLEDDFYRDYDGWLVFWRQGYVAQDGGTGEWSIPDMGTGGYVLDMFDWDTGMDTSRGYYLRFEPLPEDLPDRAVDLSLPSSQSDVWQLLAELPGEDIALYNRKWDNQKVYLRYGDRFQVFAQDLSKENNLLPEMERVDENTISIQYRRQEGTYFNGETTEPGVVGERVQYQWMGNYWLDIHIGTSLMQSQPDLPALEDLPTEILTDVPGAYQEPILLLAELPQEDIAIYADQRSGYHGLIRYGNHLQWVSEPLNMEAMRFEDLDGDGENELAVTYLVGRGTGAYMQGLTVYEWDGESWTGHTANLEQGIIKDFNAGYTLALFPEEGRAAVEYDGNEVDVDMVARFGNRSLWAEGGVACELREEMYSYSMESYGLALTIGGEIRPEGYPPFTCYVFDYICNLYYREDGTFESRNTWSYLATDYQWSPKVDETQLTDTFRDILRGFMRETKDEIPGVDDAALANDYFAICDVNGDGLNELITQRNNGPTAAHSEDVYDYSGNLILSAYSGLVTYYDNGYATAGWSHNQGKAGDKLWPYDLLKYDGEAGKYTCLAAVDGWDKELGDSARSYLSQHNGLILFPDDVDKDGDGFVYYIIEEEGGYAPAYGHPVDYADYALWAASYLGGNAVDVHYARLTKENIALVG